MSELPVLTVVQDNEEFQGVGMVHFIFWALQKCKQYQEVCIKIYLV